ncbi:uncharacterized protein LOC113549685 [Rhopalosiphum maidis]|uniref:uncharacterized protein LOC113549685 n=1 Tax=Rhopalosiphum maidis TaxID=43146 RepID=UPI000EFF3B24|nr:uncharacterized protein LOC113549685 [Rhopalosiphum maidis]
MGNPSKMLTIFIVICYVIGVHNSYSKYSQTVQNCIDLMLRYDILFIQSYSQYSGTTIPNYVQLEDSKLIRKLYSLNISALDEPLKTYVTNFNNGIKEQALTFCEGQQ